MPLTKSMEASRAVRRTCVSLRGADEDGETAKTAWLEKWLDVPANTGMPLTKSQEAGQAVRRKGISLPGR